MHLISRIAFGALFALAVVEPASAQQAPDKQACVDAYGSAQRLRREGSLRRAREQLLLCGRPPCPAALQPECVKWLGEVEEVMPSVIFEVHEGGGGPTRTDVKVTVDGAPFTDKLDGRAVDVDPGEHRFHFETPGLTPLDQKLVIVEGEKRRKVSVELVNPSKKIVVERPVQPGGQEEAPTNWPAWLAGGIGLVALGSFVTFAAIGRSQESDLEPCKPRCLKDDVDGVRVKYLVADISLGVSIVALGVATYFFLKPSKAPVPVQVGNK
jgi:hypothetical protein